jgi:hypothetical protein
MEPRPTKPEIESTVQAYVDKIAAEIHTANKRIDEFELKSKTKRAQAEITAIEGLRTAGQNIKSMLVSLKTKGDAETVRAKADIDAALVALQGSIEDLRRKFRTPPTEE